MNGDRPRHPRDTLTPLAPFLHYPQPPAGETFQLEAPAQARRHTSCVEYATCEHPSCANLLVVRPFQRRARQLGFRVYCGQVCAQAAAQEEVRNG